MTEHAGSVNFGLAVGHEDFLTLLDDVPGGKGEGEDEIVVLALVAVGSEMDELLFEGREAGDGEGQIDHLQLESRPETGEQVGPRNSFVAVLEVRGGVAARQRYRVEEAGREDAGTAHQLAGSWNACTGRAGRRRWPG